MLEREIGDLFGGENACRDYRIGVRFLHSIEGLINLVRRFEH